MSSKRALQRFSVSCGPHLAKPEAASAAGVKPCLDGEPYLQLLSMLCGSLNTAVAEALQKAST